MRKVRDAILLVFIPLILLCAIAYLIPAVRSRVDWRVEQVRLQVRYALFPPEEAVFTPQDQDQVAAIVQSTLQALTPSPTVTPTITPSWTPGPTQPPTVTPTPTLSPTPIPNAVKLTGVRYVDQHGKYNYCAPANMAMALNYRGWQATRGELGQMVEMIREVERAMVIKGKKVFPEEQSAAKKLRKSIVFSRDLPAGHVLCEADLTTRSPWVGISPVHWDEVLGATVKRPVKHEEPLQWDLLSLIPAVGSNVATS